MFDFRSHNLTKSVTWLVLALAASAIQVNVPRSPGRSHSLNFVFVLMAIIELSYAETVLIAFLAAAVQVMAHRESSAPWKASVFELASVALAAAVAYQSYHSEWMASQQSLIRLALTSVLLYAGNTFPLAAMAALKDRRRLSIAWRELYVWSFPYYLGGACVAGILHAPSNWSKEFSLVLVLPTAFVVYFGAHLYTAWLAGRKDHLERMASLQQRTIECLALAIEAKDHSAHNHLVRLRTYAVVIAQEMGLSENEIEALRIAAVLHDVGKLAIPEHILAKPAPLTREEFERVKLHAAVGAEILERVNFPYPVASIVRHHHERWDGKGYPSGLSGTAIPAGARILAVVDCFDALISERPYRKAYTVREAIDRIGTESGLSFDPQIVAILERKYIELEARIRESAREAEIKLRQEPRAAVPGYQPHWEDASRTMAAPNRSAFDSIIAARKEEQVLFVLTRQLGNSLHLDDACLALANELSRLIGFSSLAVYVSNGDVLCPRFVHGVAARQLGASEVPMGHGIVGSVALHGKASLNGDPSIELSIARRRGPALPVSSAVAVPLVGESALVGVLLMIEDRQNAFTEDHLRLLQSVSCQLGSMVENSLKYEQAASSASTDFLTGLPNARALSEHLEAEIARGRRLGGELVVLVTDLDGFKSVNDRFGHLEGNRILCAVANALRQTCREYDYVGRLGGDEFVLILPGLRESDISARVEELEQAVMRATRTIRPEIPVGLSIGIARCLDGKGTAQSLLADADRAMYRNKAFRKGTGNSLDPRGYAFDSFESLHQ